MRSTERKAAGVKPQPFALSLKRGSDWGQLDFPYPPPPGVSIRIRSPARAFNDCLLLKTDSPSGVTRVDLPGKPGSPPFKPYGGTRRLSAKTATLESASSSISRTMPFPPRYLPRPPDPFLIE